MCFAKSKQFLVFLRYNRVVEGLRCILPSTNEQSGNLTNQKSPFPADYLIRSQEKRPIRKEDTKRNKQSTFYFFSFFHIFFFHFFFHSICLASNNTKFCTIVVASTGFSFPAILFSLFASYNLIIFYELALSLVFWPFSAILFS